MAEPTMRQTNAARLVKERRSLKEARQSKIKSVARAGSQSSWLGWLAGSENQ
jgi:hypothetical protein